MVAWFSICVHYHGRLILPLNKYRNKKSGRNLTADNVVRWNFSITFYRNWILLETHKILCFSGYQCFVFKQSFILWQKQNLFTKQLIRTFSTTIEHMCRNAYIIQSIVGNVVIILRQHIVCLDVLTKSIEFQLLFGI